MKTCTKCRRNLPETSFNKHTRTKSGLRAECRECQSERSKGYAGSAKPRSQEKTKYIKKRVNGFNIPFHRYVMSFILGRPLESCEVVHHINGKKHDNRPENLQVMSASEHSRLENLGKKLSDEHKAKLSKSLIGNQRRLGIPHSQEIKDIIGQKSKEARKRKFWSTRKKSDH